MAKVADRVKETTTTEGTGTYSLGGAVTGFQSFVAGIGDGGSCYYCVTDGNDWEVGIGTVTDDSTDTLSRDTILASSNSGNAVDWGAGSKDVFVTIPASVLDDEGPGPLWLPAPAIHLDARWRGGMTRDGSENVSVWRSENGQTAPVEFTQPTSGDQPTFVTDGGRGVQFDGANSVLYHAVASVLSGSRGEVWAVVTLEEDPADVVGGQSVVLGSSDTGGTGNSVLLLALQPGTTAGKAKARIVQGNLSGTLNAVAGDAEIEVGERVLLVWASNGAAWSISVDGVVQSLTVVLGSNTGTWWGDTSGRDNVTVGAFDAGAFASYYSSGGRAFLGGRIHELIAFNNVNLSGSQTRAMYKRLVGKWNLSVAIDEGL